MSGSPSTFTDRHQQAGPRHEAGSVTVATKVHDRRVIRLLSSLREICSTRLLPASEEKVAVGRQRRIFIIRCRALTGGEEEEEKRSLGETGRMF